MMNQSPLAPKRLLVVAILLLFTAFGGITGFALADEPAEEPFTHPVVPGYYQDEDPTPEPEEEGEGEEDGDDEGTDEEDGSGDYDPPEDCRGCHSESFDAWDGSLHHQAYAAEYFQEAWNSVDQDPSCLSCHTTEFTPSTGEFADEGVTCVACHGDIPEGHPDEPVQKEIANESCQDCHPQTHDEFITTDHAAVGLDCLSCHYAHDNGLRLEDATAQCLNCHGDALEGFVHTSHIEGGLECRDCHGWVNPEVEEPITGLGYTGHDFMSEIPACLDCHDDLDLEVVADNREPGETSDVAEEQVLRGQEAITENEQLRNTIQTLLQVEYNRTVQNVSLGAIGGLVVGSVVTAIALHFQKDLTDEEEESDE